MNLKALFNKNFFKENLKKSKGMLAFFFGVVPLINLLVLVIGTKRQVLSFNEISLVTYLGLYIIPIVFALALFNFVFKRVATDFVMAKPVSRKTIYVTNVLGGIGVIALFILLNAGIFGFFGLLFPNLVIPGAMIFDYIIFWFISYVFVFLVAVLAITLAGNLIGSLVVVAIIVCMFPFLDIAGLVFKNRNVDYYVNIKNVNVANYNCRNKECLSNLSKGNYRIDLEEGTSESYTTPALIVSSINGKTIFNVPSLIKMIILSVVYGMLGCWSFRLRKMENNEVSFKSEFGHYLVKTLTFLPFCLASYWMMKLDFMIGLIVSLVGAFIYYIVYDLITRKAIYRFKKSMLVALFTFLLLNCGYLMYDFYTRQKSVVIEDIQKMIVNYGGEELEIKDKNLMMRILADAISENRYSYNVGMIKSKNKTYMFDFVISDDTGKLLDDYYNKTMQEKILNYNYKGIDYNNLEIKNTKEFKKLVEDYMKKEGVIATHGSLHIYDYRDHDYQVLNVPYENDKKLSRYILNESNKRILKFWDKNVRTSELDCSTEVMDGYKLEMVNYIIRNSDEEIKKYLKNENTEIVDSDACRFRVFREESEDTIIGDLDKFLEFIAGLEDNFKNDAEYKRLKELAG